MDLSLEIHHLDTHGGDATAIIVKELGDMETTLCRVLIDAGAEGSGSAYLAPYLKDYLGGVDFDYLIATHYHKDHIQGFIQANVNFQQYMDNGGYTVSGVKVNPINGIGQGVGGSNIFGSYAAHIQSKVSSTRVQIPFITDGGTAGPVVLELGKNTGIKLTCICANGILANGANVLKAQKESNKTTKLYSPNDLSLAFLLEWEDFTYFTAGDLSGDKSFSSYYNVEEELLKYLTDATNGPLKGKALTAFKASHHGSEHSNDPDLFKKLKPKLVITSCNQPKKVPSPKFLERLNDYFADNNTATVAFTNWLKVYKNDDRYGKLDAIKNFIAKDNVVFTKTANDEEIASNLGIKAITIRRRTGGVNYTDKLNADVLKIEKDSYEILLRKRDPKDKDSAETIMRFKTYAMKLNILKSLDIMIGEGFNNQASKIVEWINQDRSGDASVGIDYVQENFPGLVKVIEQQTDTTLLKDVLTTRMKFLFTSSYEPMNIAGVDYFAPKASNPLTSDEKETLWNLLMNNKHQAGLNFTHNICNYPESNPNTWREDRAWNFAGEPYVATDDKRKNILEPSGGDSKRLKEEEDDE